LAGAVPPELSPDPAGPSRPGRGYRDLLRNRRWLLWELSATTASVGYAVYAISIPWFAFLFSGSFLVVGLVLFVEVGIYSLTFLVGPLVDRARNKRTVYLACYPAQAVAAAFLGAAIAAHFLTVPLLLGLIAFISFLWDIAWAANNAAPALLLEPDQFFRAVGLGTLLGGTTTLGGFSGGALLVVFVGAQGGMCLYAGLLVVASALVLPLSIPAPDAPHSAYFADFLEGWRYFSGAGGAVLRRLASVEVLRGFFSTAPTVLIVVLADRTFAGASGAYSLLYVAWVVGGIAIAVYLGDRNPRRAVGGILIASLLAGGALVALVVVPGVGLLVASVAWFAFGASGTAYATAFYVYLRGAFPANALGRISGDLYLFTGSAGAVGAVVLGALASSWTLPELGGVVAVGLLVSGALLASMPAVRRLGF
jgi:hypothetical protein